MVDSLRTVASLLTRANVRYVVIGAHAVNVWRAASKTAFQAEVVRRAHVTDTGIPMATPEDLIVQKAIANRAKDQVDLQGLVGLADLDWAYVEKWAAEWGVQDIVERARAASSSRTKGS